MTDEERRQALKAMYQAAKDLAAVLKRIAPEVKAITGQFRDAMESFVADKKPKEDEK